MHDLGAVAQPEATNGFGDIAERSFTLSLRVGLIATHSAPSRRPSGNQRRTSVSAWTSAAPPMRAKAMRRRAVMKVCLVR